MKTLQQFIEEACQEFEKSGWEKVCRYDDDTTVMVDLESVKPFLRTKLLESATLTAEALKCETKSLLGDMAYTGGDAPKNYIAFQRKPDIHYSSYNSAFTEIETKKKAWFDTK